MAEPRLVERAKIILLSDEGLTVENIARQWEVAQRASRSGGNASFSATSLASRTYDAETESRV